MRETILAHTRDRRCRLLSFAGNAGAGGRHLVLQAVRAGILPSPQAHDPAGRRSRGSLGNQSGKPIMHHLLSLRANHTAVAHFLIGVSQIAPAMQIFKFSIPPPLNGVWIVLDTHTAALHPFLARTSPSDQSISTSALELNSRT